MLATPPPTVHPLQYKEFFAFLCYYPYSPQSRTICFALSTSPGKKIQKSLEEHQSKSDQNNASFSLAVHRIRGCH
jgi:hypothetical protein